MSTQRRPNGSPTPSGNGRYWRIKKPDHPLADRQGFVDLHRFVHFAETGPADRPCWHCGRIVSWRGTTGPTRLVVDHLNDDGHDNRPVNLVSSCQSCNAHRRVHPWVVEWNRLKALVSSPR